MADSPTKAHFKARGKELAEGFQEGSKAIGRGAKGRFLASPQGEKGRAAVAKAQAKATQAKGAMAAATSRLSILTERLTASADAFAHSVGASLKSRLPQFGPRRGFEVRAGQWQAALMLPFLVVVMMAVVTVIYQATIQVIVGLGLTNVAFLWFVQTIMGLGLLLVGIFSLVKWVESGGFGIFRWS